MDWGKMQNLFRGATSEAAPSQQTQSGPSQTIPSQTIPSPSSHPGSSSQAFTTSTALPSQSTNPIDNRPWTVEDIGQNSIAAVLNDPSTPRSLMIQKVDQVSKQTLAAIPKTQIRHVKLKEFDLYLEQNAQWIHRWLELRVHTLQGDPLLFDSKSVLLPASAAAAAASSVSPTSPEKQSQIPAVFFESDFNLENPRVFDLVTEYANVCSSVPAIGSSLKSPQSPSTTVAATTTASMKSPDGTLPVSPTSHLTTNSILQEKLSRYLDSVEAQLVTEISRRSLEFFSALSNIQSLHSDTKSTLEQLRHIRASLALVSQQQVTRGLEVIRQKKRRRRLMTLLGSIQTIRDIKKTQPMIQILLHQGDYVGALDLIQETQGILKGDGFMATLGRSAAVASAGAVTNGTPSHNATVSSVSERMGTVDRVPLQGVKGLVHLTGQLAEMQKMIGTLMETDLSTVLMNDIQAVMQAGMAMERGALEDPAFLNAHSSVRQLLSWAVQTIQVDKTTGSASSDCLSRFSDDKLGRSEVGAVEGGLLVNVADVETEGALRARLTPLLMGLVRTERLGFALQQYRDQLLKALKNITKQYLPPALPEERDGGGGGDGSLAKRFKVMTYDAFLKMVCSVFVLLLQLQQRIATLNTIVVRILKEAESSGVLIGGDKSVMDAQPAGNPKDPSMDLEKLRNSSNATMNYSQYISEIHDILFAVSDLAHVRCGKLLLLRADQNAQLNSKDFFKLFEKGWRFLVLGEQLCQRNCIGLRGTLTTQAKAFLNYFHMERMKQITLLIDNEQWTQAEVPLDFQGIVNRITATSPSTPNVPLDQPETDEGSGRAASANTQQRLFVNKEPFYVVLCALLFVKMLEEYLYCVKQIPTLSPEVLNRLIEITKLFNTRVCGVIVGGAAVQSATLKSITAKHLALAAQSLDFVIALLPFVKAQLVSQLPPKQQALADDLNRVIEDFKQNRDQVYHRVVMIMEDRVRAHCEGIGSANLESPLPEGEEASAYMKNLVKETQKLHKILQKFATPSSLKQTFLEIFNVYDKRLELELNKIDLSSTIVKGRVLQDVQYYISSMSAMEGVSGPGNHLEVLVNNMRVKDPRRPTTGTSFLGDLRMSQPPSVSPIPPPKTSGEAQTHTAPPAHPHPAHLMSNSSTNLPQPAPSSQSQLPSIPIAQQSTSSLPTQQNATNPLSTSMNAAQAKEAAKKFGQTFTTSFASLGKFMSTGTNSTAATNSTAPKAPPANTANVPTTNAAPATRGFMDRFVKPATSHEQMPTVSEKDTAAGSSK